MRTSFVAALVAVGMAASGCATIIHGTRQNVHFDTEPAGCRVTVDGADYGVTPCDVILPRKDEHVVALEKQGYRRKTLRISQDFDAVTILNVLLPGCLIWGGVDFVSGAAWDLNPAFVSIVLEPDSPTAQSP